MKIVLGVFHNKPDASEAIAQLESHDFNPKDLSVIMRDSDDAKELAAESGVNMGSHIAGGAVTGGMIGGLAGLLIGIGAITIPGVGALLVAGPLTAALGLTGAVATTAAGAMTGAVAGGIVGALTSLGISEDDARAYEKSIQEGGILLVVPVGRGEAEEVADILQYCNADQIRTTTEPEKITAGNHTKKVVDRGGYSPAYYSEVSRDPEDLDEIE